MFFGGSSLGLVDISLGWLAYWFGVMEEVVGAKLFEPNTFPRLHARDQNFKEISLVKENLPDHERLSAHFKRARESFFVDLLSHNVLDIMIKCLDLLVYVILEEKWKKELLKNLVSETDLRAIEAIPIPSIQRHDIMVWQFNSSSIIRAIEAIPIPLIQRQDIMVWHFNSSGLCSVKSRQGILMRITASSRSNGQFVAPGMSILWLSFVLIPPQAAIHWSNGQFVAHPSSCFVLKSTSVSTEQTVNLCK
ncbi:hypothetical protein RHSIM_Rhsim09G0044800 [Rhododendron simsii]|uniref:Uncharacterized protein n=1 Tax=Rhododendron simsii TaxID=118357 RepID=A0A834GFI0_RHOSS|nr:hypothetical protein RHSIM_Rhsim09G0044800 [Rhododendron simsii]